MLVATDDDNSGVPQESVVGFLFIIYIDSVHCSYLLLADDTALTLCIRTIVNIFALRFKTLTKYFKDR